MNEELIKIFDENRNERGVASRYEVHQNGYWHETFHCWMVKNEKGHDYIYLQIRSDQKKDYPSLLDITAAGHILADETVEDGVREIEEELGIAVTYEELQLLGVMEDCIKTDTMIDREFAHVYVYRLKDGTTEFKLQKEEVSGMVRAELADFYRFCLGSRDEMLVEGFMVDELGKESAVKKRVTKADFVPHPESYFINVAKKLSETL